MEYEEALNLWAAKKFNLVDVEKVWLNIDIVHGGYCETCDFTYAVIHTYVKTAKEDLKFEESEYNFGGLIKEIVEVANANN